VKRSLVQIWVVVANTKEHSLRVEEEKGSTRTAIDRGLIDPKPQINLKKGVDGRVSGGPFRRSSRGSSSQVGSRGEREAG